MMIISHHNPFFPAIVGIAFGFAVHHGIFIHGEWHVQAPHILSAHVLVAALLLAGKVILADSLWSNWPAALSTGFYYGYIPGIYLSILIYRCFFHRLNKFNYPGPWYVRISKLWHVWAARDASNHLLLDSFHRKYGDIVRTGPAEVTVFTPDVFAVVDGPGSTCIKSEFYDLLASLNHKSLVSTRDIEVHAIRRREWMPGFSKHMLDSYQQRISKHIDEFLLILGQDADSGAISEMRQYIYWFSFDAMGEFAFSKSFDLLKEKRSNPVVDRWQRALYLIGPVAAAPWLLHIGLRLAPSISRIKDFRQTLQWCSQEMQARLKKRAQGDGSEIAEDLAYFIIEDTLDRTNRREEKNRSWNTAWLTGDSLLSIIAGSDPITFGLIGLFAELAKHPEQAEKLFEELSDVDVTNSSSLAGLQHLNALILEALRLYPALPTGGSRKTQSTPVVIGGHVIPPYTTIVAPKYTINRREDCYTHAKEFIPERWTTRPELIKDRSGHTPFGTGKSSCLGRPIAEQAMRALIARVVKRFKIKLAPGDAGDRVMKDVRDQFVTLPGCLHLCFERR